MQSKRLYIAGMTCTGCENRIRAALKNVEGVKGVRVSYKSGTADVTYDESALSINEIIAIIEKLDYKASDKPFQSVSSRKSAGTKAVGAVIILFALYFIVGKLGAANIFGAFPQAREGTGYGMLFVIGLLTSLHCVAMCGGINLSQCIPQSSESRGVTATLVPSFLYNLGRVISYTVIGGLVGALGSVISFTGTMKGIVQIAAGVFMVIMGLNMLDVFPWLRKLIPRFPAGLARKVNGKKSSKSPLIVGLLNGLMPCGPLQAMQLYALSTGSPIKGALSMLLFSLGTVPLMFGLGAFTSLISKKSTRTMMKVCAALVVVLGISMLQNGMSLSGIGIPLITGRGNVNNIATIEGDIQTVTTKLSPGSYEPITVQKGIPVRWIIKAESDDINGCNNEIFIPEYQIEKKLRPGDNIIEFTPVESGVYPYTCWMGMIRSSITVVDDLSNR